MSTSDNYFFVYGTLKQGEGNHHLLQSKYTAFQEGRLYNAQLYVPEGKPHHYPKLVVVDDYSSYVDGEIYRIKEEKLDEMMWRLDRLEGVASGLYDRTKLWVRDRFGDGETLCWVYMVVDPGTWVPLESNEWVSR